MPPREPAPSLKNTPQSPRRWETAELASVRAVLETCPQQRWSTVLPQSLHLGRERALREPWGKSCLGWIRHMQIGRTLQGSVLGSCIFQVGAGRIRPLACGAPSWVTIPLSLGGKDADVSGQGRSSPDTFTPAVEAVGGLFSSLPQSGCSWGGSAASTSNLRQGKSDPALTVAVLSWG